MANLIEIEVTDAGEITVGAYVFRTFYQYISAQSKHTLIGAILDANGFLDPREFLHIATPTKEMCLLRGFDYFSSLVDGDFNISSYDMPRLLNKYYAYVLGAGFVKCLLKIMYREWLAPFKGHLKEFGTGSFRGGGFVGNSQSRVYMLRKSPQLARQIISDDLFHIAPFVLLFRMCPKELRALFGKGLWRRLCANSRSRNSLIVSTLLDGLCGAGVRYNTQNSFSSVAGISPDKGDDCYTVDIIEMIASGRRESRIVEIINELNGFSSTYLTDIIWIERVSAGDEFFTGVKGDDFFCFEGHRWAHGVAKQQRKLTTDTPWSIRWPIHFLRLFHDTHEMALRLKAPFNPDWSYRRMIKEHKKLLPAVLRIDYPGGDFPHTKKLPAGIEIEAGSSTAVGHLVKRPSKVAELMDSHSNRIGAHIKSLSSPRYLLYRLFLNGSDVACLLSFRRSGWQIDGTWFQKGQCKHPEVPALLKALTKHRCLRAFGDEFSSSGERFSLWADAPF